MSEAKYMVRCVVEKAKAKAGRRYKVSGCDTHPGKADR